MLVFVDFEASSLGRDSYPIEVAWVFEDGGSEQYLIRPAEAWTDWDPNAAAIHRIGRGELIASGTSHEQVARRMVDTLSGHDLLASAPSWDGRWLSVLLRAAGLPRRSLRLRDSDDELRATAISILAPLASGGRLETLAEATLATAAAAAARLPVAHRALADAEAERRQWLAVREEASRLALALSPSETG